MRAARLPVSLALAALLLAACNDTTVQAPPAQEPPPGAVGQLCNMTLDEHDGPKGQIFLKGDAAPLWFSTVRDTFAFTLMQEVKRPVVAIYVNDMGRASWAKPEPGTWIDARRALFVAGSRRTSGMGVTELVPFGTPETAAAFVRQWGGRTLAYADVTPELVFAEPENAEKKNDDHP